MTESERERLLAILDGLLIELRFPSDHGIRLVAEAEAILRRDSPASRGFALVGPDGRAIAETCDRNDAAAKMKASEWGWEQFELFLKPGWEDFPRRDELPGKLAWLAAHGFHIKPVEFRVVPEPEGQE